MFYDDAEDLDDPPMSPISIPLPTPPSTPKLRTLDTPVVAREWNEDMLPVRVVLNPESHLEFKSSLRSSEISATPTVMIDSGATAEFINQRLVEALGLPLIKKTHPRPLYTVDGSKIKSGSVRHEVEIHLSIADHSETLRLDVVDIGRHDVILGIPWLHRLDRSSGPSPLAVYSPPLLASLALLHTYVPATGRY